MNELEFLQKLSDLGVGFTIRHYDPTGGFIDLSPDGLLSYYKLGHHKFWAEYLNVNVEDLELFIEQCSHYGDNCMAITKAKKPCKNQAICYTDIYEYIEKRSTKEIFCTLHDDLYVKDIHE